MRNSSLGLGIHDGHNSSACIIRNGEIIAAVSEERLSRQKNEAGYPQKAIETVIRMANCEPKELQYVALGTRMMHHREFFDGWEWYRKNQADQVREAQQEPDRRKHFLEDRIRERKAQISNHLSLDEAVVHIVEHHHAHAAAAYYASPWAGDGKEVLVLTLDGSGDGVCATVNVAKNGELTRIAETKSAASIGKVYSRVTFLLGMKPWEHEYKVMGLAPYADTQGVERSYAVLKQLVALDDTDLVFRTGTSISTNYCYGFLRDQLENHRFDWIAGAIQRLTEELVVEWVKRAIRKTQVRRVACGGGVFMNVKANMLLAELAEVSDLFVFPSCGDESLCFGSAYAILAANRDVSNGTIKSNPLRTPYLGPAYSNLDIEKAIGACTAGKRYRIEQSHNLSAKVAGLMANGAIIARYQGGMEWGARALGNRSIIMDPRRVDNVQKLNSAIKHRDFWMPFAPTILSDRASEYIVNPKGIPSPFMLFAFRTTDKGRRDLAAAVHPYDHTARPQILEREANPEYYNLIKEFELLTGIGGVLNTSFNLHGEPIVCSPEDAISVFDRSGLEHLYIGEFLISKQLK